MSIASENLIETLKVSLRQTQIAEKNRIANLEEVRTKIDGLLKEAERIIQEINALQLSAKQTEAAIESLSQFIPNGIDIRKQ